MKQPREIELRVEELVLHGFAPGDRHGIAEAVQRELARLLGRDGAPEGWRPIEGKNVEVDRIDAGTVRHAPDAGARQVGREVARTVWRGLRGGMRR